MLKTLLTFYIIVNLIQNNEQSYKLYVLNVSVTLCFDTFVLIIEHKNAYLRIINKQLMKVDNIQNVLPLS